MANCAYPQLFEEVSDSLGIQHFYGYSEYGGGVSFYDFNYDGWDDITIAGGDGDIHFYVNDAGSFTRLEGLISGIHHVKQILWVDFDNDEDADLFVTTLNKNLLFRNNGDLEMEDVSTAYGISSLERDTYGAAFGDYDRDGWLDLYITDKDISGETDERANIFMRNENGERFKDVTLKTGTSDSSRAPLAVSFFDYNKDLWADFYIAQDKRKVNSLFENTGEGNFIRTENTGAEVPMNGMCVSVADYNNDSWQDIYVTNTDEGNILLRNNGAGTFDEVAEELGVTFNQFAWSASFMDVDNDGYQDLYVCNQWGENKLYMNELGKGFTEIPEISTIEHIDRSSSSAMGDIDNDGKLDFMVSNTHEYSSKLWWNRSELTGNWIKFNLESNYSNNDALGARIEVYCEGNVFSRYLNGATGFLAQNSRYEHVGIGDYEQVDSLLIYWPSGVVDRLTKQNVNQMITVEEGVNASLAPMINDGIDTITICSTDSVKLKSQYYGRNFEFLWSNGESTSTVWINETGNYSLLMTDIDGSEYRSAEVVVEALQSPALTAEISPATIGMADGALDFEVIGVAPPYQFFWNNFNVSVSDLMENLSAGEYTITVTDANSCQTSATFIIGERTPLSSIDVNKFSIFPNPTRNELTISGITQETQFHLFDISGNLIFAGVVQGSKTIDLSAVESGLYIFKVADLQQLIIKK